MMIHVLNSLRPLCIYHPNCTMNTGNQPLFFSSLSWKEEVSWRPCTPRALHLYLCCSRCYWFGAFTKSTSFNPPDPIYGVEMDNIFTLYHLENQHDLWKSYPIEIVFIRVSFSLIELFCWWFLFLTTSFLGIYSDR
jgi:hypothetical protein